MYHNEDSINYSLGALIVLLMFFWFICKCVGQSEYNKLYHNNERFADNTKMMYGNTPMKLSKSPIPYIRLNPSNLMEVPNSKSAYRHLFDVAEYKNSQDSVLDNKNNSDMASLFLQKKSVEKFVRQPRGMTDQRVHNNIDRRDRVAMPSY
jgi:hypothetical protein